MLGVYYTHLYNFYIGIKFTLSTILFYTYDVDSSSSSSLLRYRKSGWTGSVGGFEKK